MGLKNETDKDKNKTTTTATTDDGAVKTGMEVVAPLSNTSIMNAEQLGKQLKQFTREVEITTRYLEFDINDELLCYYIEPTTIKVKDSSDATGQKDKELPAVKLLLEDGSFGVTAGAVLVNNLTKLNRLTPLKLICIGEVKSGNGKYKDFKIIQLG